MAKAWSVWAARHMYLKNLMRVAKTTILRWMFGLKSKCFQKWWHDHVVRSRIARRPLERMRCRFVAKAWSKWDSEVVRSRKIKRTLLHWAKRHLSLAFVAWDILVQEVKPRKDGSRNPRLLIERTIKHWQNQALSSAFNGWTTEMNRIARLRHMLSNAALKWVNRLLAVAMEKWYFEVIRKRKALKAVAMWTHGNLEHAPVILSTLPHTHTHTRIHAHAHTQVRLPELGVRGLLT